MGGVGTLVPCYGLEVPNGGIYTSLQSKEVNIRYPTPLVPYHHANVPAYQPALPRRQLCKLGSTHLRYSVHTSSNSGRRKNAHQQQYRTLFHTSNKPHVMGRSPSLASHYSHMILFSLDLFSCWTFCFSRFVISDMFYLASYGLMHTHSLCHYHYHHDLFYDMIYDILCFDILPPSRHK